MEQNENFFSSSKHQRSHNLIIATIYNFKHKYQSTATGIALQTLKIRQQINWVVTPWKSPTPFHLFLVSKLRKRFFFYKNLFDGLVKTVYVIPSNTKNQAVKNVPMASNTVVKYGNTVGLIGDIYLAASIMKTEL